MSSYGLPDPSRPFLADLASEDWQDARDGVRRAEAWLRLGTGTEAEVSSLGERLVELASHPHWGVRRAVALAIEHLRHHSFQLAIAPLLKDSNHSVQVGAQRSLARWTQAGHRDVLSDQHAAQLNRWLGEIETRHGPKTREAAMRLAQQYGDMLVREASHEIKKFLLPLDQSLVRLRKEVAKPVPDSQAMVDGVREAHERTRLTIAVLRGLREFATHTRPKFRVELVHPILAQAVGLVRDKLGPAVDPFAVELGLDEGLRVEGHRDRLLQAFSNIIQNSFESYDGMPGQRRLEIAVRAEAGSRVTITFTDHGCGMTVGELRSAFQLYRTTKVHGTGFGLPLVMKIVKNEHQGAVTLKSVKGEGTSVLVMLPVSQEGRG